MFTNNIQSYEIYSNTIILGLQCFLHINFTLGNDLYVTVLGINKTFNPVVKVMSSRLKTNFVHYNLSQTVKKKAIEGLFITVAKDDLDSNQ